jgi:hypothetical protein
MQLLDEIIGLAVDNQASISVLLRKCLVLAYQLKNDRLRLWVNKELNGYEQGDELPEYRKVPTVAKGTFVASFGRSLPDQPLQSSVMKPEHRHFATTARLVQPIIAYEQMQDGSSKKVRPAIYWPQDITVMYQSKFLEYFVLLRAWQEIGTGTFASVIDTVRNRVLNFALDLGGELGIVNDNLGALPQAKVDQSIVTYIFGGHNVISGTAQTLTQIGAITVGKGEITELTTALKNIGLPDADVSDLKAALEKDADGGEPTLGRRTAMWVKGLGIKFAQAGTQVAVDTVKAEATKLIMKYLGIL